MVIRSHLFTLFFLYSFSVALAMDSTEKKRLTNRLSAQGSRARDALYLEQAKQILASEQIPALSQKELAVILDLEKQLADTLALRNALPYNNSKKTSNALSARISRIKKKITILRAGIKKTKHRPNWTDISSLVATIPLLALSAAENERLLKSLLDENQNHE